MFILYLSLEIALLAHVEHAPNQWKHLLALPVSRMSIYLAKLLLGIIIVTARSVLLLLEALAAVFLFSRFHPNSGISLQAVNVSSFVEIFFFASIAALPIIALHTWLSVRSRNFILPIGLGAVGGFVNLIGGQSAVIQKFSPWAFPFNMMRAFHPLAEIQTLYKGWSPMLLLLISTVGSIVITVYAIWEIHKRDVVERGY